MLPHLDHLIDQIKLASWNWLKARIPGLKLSFYSWRINHVVCLACLHHQQRSNLNGIIAVGN